MTRITINRSRLALIISLMSIMCIAGFLRWYALGFPGPRFHDEGVHLADAANLTGDHANLGFRHGLVCWYTLGMMILGWTWNAALFWSGLWGLMTSFVVYLIGAKIMCRRAALFASFMMAINYYCLFYHRSALSDGHSLFFFSLTLLFLLELYGSCSFLRLRRLTPSAVTRRWQFSLLLLCGALLGFSFTIRVQSCVNLLGMMGAFGLFFIYESFSTKQYRPLLKLALVDLTLVLIAAVAYLSFMLLISEKIDWSNTYNIYVIQKNFATRPRGEWSPWILIFLYRFCCIPLLLGAAIGFVMDVLRFRRLSEPRIWFALAFLGLFALSLIVALPFPRAYVYLLFFLCLYWGLGVNHLRRLPFSRKMINTTTLLLVLFTFIGESFLWTHLLTRKSGYEEACKLLMANGIRRGSRMIGTTSWPLFSTVDPDIQVLLLDDVTKHVKNADQLLASILKIKKTWGAQFLVIDNGFLYYSNSDETRVVSEFVSRYPANQFIVNEFGTDFHTCMDAFGDFKPDSVIADKIFIYKLFQRRGELPRGGGQTQSNPL